MRVNRTTLSLAGFSLTAIWLLGLSGILFGGPITAQGRQTASAAAQSSLQSPVPTSSASQAPEPNAATPPPTSSAALSSAQVKAVLDRLFLVESRIKDLLGILQTTSWKMTDAERQEIGDSISSAQQKVQDLEKWRYQYYYHLDNATDAQKTRAALDDLQPLVASIGGAAGKYQGARAGGQFQEASHDLDQVAGQLWPQAAASPASKEGSPKRPTSGPASAPVSPAAPPATASTTSVPKPAEATSAVPPVPPIAAPSVTSDQAKALLDKLFLTESRVKDLLGTLQTTSWKLSEMERQEIDESTSSAQQKIQDLERWRYQFYYHLDNPGDGQKTQAALETLQPVVASIGAEAGTHQGAAAGSQFQQASQDLASISAQLKPYVSGMEARMKELLSSPAKTPGGGPGLETEVIRAQPSIKPLNSIVTQPPPLSPPQVKQLLYKVYVPAFRIKDLLSQEQPEKWKAPTAEQDAFNASRQDLLKSLVSLEHWRSLFSVHPADLNSGFQAYVSIDRVLEPLESVTLRVAQYESPQIAANYQKTAVALRAQQDNLLPYLTFLFTHHDQAVEMYQTDLSNCQNQLGFAMHGLRTQVTPMKNVLPQFQGRNVRRRKEAEKKSAAKGETSKKRASSHRPRKKRHHHTTHTSAAASGK